MFFLKGVLTCEIVTQVACLPCCLQVTFQGVELYDSVHSALHIMRSEAVAVIGVDIWGDPLMPNSGGIVIEGSRRVYLGGNVISTADNAITLRTTKREHVIIT